MGEDVPSLTGTPVSNVRLVKKYWLSGSDNEDKSHQL